MNLIELGTRIRERRELRGLKQVDIANALQISSQAVSKWERGENAPDISILCHLAALLGISVEWLLGGYQNSRDVFEATIMVTSVQGFARKSMELAPRELALWVDSHQFMLTETVLSQDGVPVKQLGDGVLAFYSGNGHRQRASESAAMLANITEERLKIALTTGKIYLGSLGHPDYAQLDILGETVNRAFFLLAVLDEESKSGILADSALEEHLKSQKLTTNLRNVHIPLLETQVDLVEILT